MPKKISQQKPPTLVSQAEFAEKIGVTKGRVTQLKSEGKLVMVGKKVNLEESLALHQSKQQANEEIQAARAKADHFRALNMELDYKIRIGKLISREEAERASFEEGRRVRNAILNLPVRLAPMLVSRSDQFEIRQILEGELRQMLEDLSVPD